VLAPRQERGRQPDRLNPNAWQWRACLLVNFAAAPKKNSNFFKRSCPRRARA